jgi:flagellar M-ring protein FliF
MDKITDSFRKFFEPLSMAQKIMFVLLTGLIVLFLGLLLRWTLKPDYALLFGSLQPEAAQEMIIELDRQSISYRVEDSGRAIYVPAGRVHELRMILATTGHAGPGLQGYELFDANALGMTDFMQQVNSKRALEGELSRSINTIDQIEFARIHLVLPERSAFQQNAVPASASVILSVKRGQALSKQQVEAITGLIAGSVQGLDATNVTILDQNGNRLTEGLDGGSASGSAAAGIQMRQRTESYLTERGQSMLDRVLGPGNSILRVATDHDFDRIMRESEIIDPDSRIIISEEQTNDIGNDQGFAQVPFDEFTPIAQRGQTVLLNNRENETIVRTRNYEVGRSREVHERMPGEVRRITASVLLNYKKAPGESEEGGPVYVPYTNEEMQELYNVVRTALGMQPARGDELTMTQIMFYDPILDQQYGDWLEQPMPWGDIIRYVMILIALLAVVGLVYSMTRKLNNDSFDVLFKESPTAKEVLQDQQQLSEGKRKPEIPPISPEDFMHNKLSTDARRHIAEKSIMVDEIKSFIAGQTEEATNVVRAMMAD